VLTLKQQRAGEHGAGRAVLIRQANEAEQAGDTEGAAALLAELIAGHGDADGSRESRLRSLSPPPPAHVLASSQRDSVRVEWQPAPTRAGHVRYRVVRCSGGPAQSPSAGLAVAETASLSVTDHEPPNGVRLYYTVFATRGADAWSAGTSAAEVLRLPEVADFRLEAQPDAIAGSWHVAPGGTDVIVTRAAGSPPGSASGHPVPASLVDFHDPGLQPGTRYYYRVCAVYVNDTGERWQTTGIVRWATPDTAPEAVPDLRADLQPADDSGIVLTWPTAAAGKVQIYRSNGPPPWQAGTSVGLLELTRFGHPVPGRVVSEAPGESSIRTRVFNGRNFFTAITLGAERAVVGARTTIAAMSPVTEPQARRDGDHAWSSGPQALGCRRPRRPSNADGSVSATTAAWGSTLVPNRSPSRFVPCTGTRPGRSCPRLSRRPSPVGTSSSTTPSIGRTGGRRGGGTGSCSARTGSASCPR
jgi:hypothetical protein